MHPGKTVEPVGLEHPGGGPEDVAAMALHFGQSTKAPGQCPRNWPFLGRLTLELSPAVLSVCLSAPERGDELEPEPRRKGVYERRRDAGEAPFGLLYDQCQQHRGHRGHEDQLRVPAALPPCRFSCHGGMIGARTRRAVIGP